MIESKGNGIRSQAEKDAFKNKILTEVFKSGKIHEEVKKVCRRNKIYDWTNIHEDVLQETFLHLSKYNTDQLIEAYEDDPIRIVKIAVRIAIWKGVIQHPKNPSYHKHSIARHILHTSNLQSTQKQNYINTTEIYVDCTGQVKEYDFILLDESTEEDPEKSMWELIRANLSPEQLYDLEYFLDLKKGRGKFKKVIASKRDALLATIKNILEDNQIKRV